MVHLYHLNCGTLRPYLPRIDALCYVGLLETDEGLILIDSGFGTPDYKHPTWPVRFFMASTRMPRDVEETAVCQIARLGFHPADVCHIVMTHLHLDHAGGLADFPHAQVHVHALEHAAALNPHGWLAPIEYIPRHFQHQPHWTLHADLNAEWYGLGSIRVLAGADWEIHLIPMHGHSLGHCGVAVRTGDRWLLDGGDAIYPFYDDQPRMLGKPPRWLLRLASFDPVHVERLLPIWRAHGDHIDFLFAHDWVQFNALKASSERTRR